MIEYSETQLMSKLPGVAGKQIHLFLLLLDFQTTRGVVNDTYFTTPNFTQFLTPSVYCARILQ